MLFEFVICFFSDDPVDKIDYLKPYLYTFRSEFPHPENCIPRSNMNVSRELPFRDGIFPDKTTRTTLFPDEVERFTTSAKNSAVYINNGKERVLEVYGAQRP